MSWKDFFLIRLGVEGVTNLNHLGESKTCLKISCVSFYSNKTEIFVLFFFRKNLN